MSVQIDRIEISRAVEERAVHGKRVFVFEDHATAVVAWARIWARLRRAPYLISLDRHLDTRPAFNKYLRAGKWETPNFWEDSAKMVSQIDVATEESARETMRYLQNEEHINAAIQGGAIHFAFVVSPAAHRDGVSEECSRIFEMESGGEQGSLEESVLGRRVRKIEDECRLRGFESREMVLDVDLDFFESLEAASPRDPSSFFTLVRKATAITIAEEPKYARRGVDHREVRRAVFGLIERALATVPPG